VMLGGGVGVSFVWKAPSGQTVAVSLLHEFCTGIKKLWKSSGWLEWNGIDARDLYS